MKIVTHTVKPRLEGELAVLDKIAHNLWLSWNFDAVSLFIRIDQDAWAASGQNPVKMLGMVSQERFDQLAQDDSFIADLHEVTSKFERYKKGETWYKGPKSPVTAYFSMEFGIDVSLPTYSGGLGILSGDHMKTASDLGLPLVGVGLLYRQGYFKQYLNVDGFQQESYPENDWYNMPVRQCVDADGKPIIISVEMAGRLVSAAIWEVKVGRSSLYLLDTNIPENTQEDRGITATLYGGDKDMRIEQEIVLGIGGIRALRALGIDVGATHMNEGHSAFLALERIRVLMTEDKLNFKEAVQAFMPTNVFTTHTPVPAGNERFGIDLMERYFRGWVQSFGVDWNEFLALGRENPNDPNESFCMTVFALKLSAYCNGVSKLHGEVSREMWKNLWPGLLVSEVPIGSVTNGVHPRTWISHDMQDLLDRYFGPRFNEDPASSEMWTRLDKISDDELWRTHERRRERLVAFAGDHLHATLERLGVSDYEASRRDRTLSPYALTLSFARRFATYKRGNLLLTDPDRLIRLLSNKDMPLQIIFSGKAHPHDIPGKELIRELVHFSRREEVLGRIIFLEDYDMNIAHYMTSGSDVWLNTPRRPLEASGTSGMKAGMNGVLNCSVLDGWWAEAYEPSIGWAIGQGEEYNDDELQDKIESNALYDLLEREIVPMFYRRGRDNLPREWIQKMRDSMKKIGPSFSTHRMLGEYYTNYYKPALAESERLKAENYASSKSLAAFIEKAKQAWARVAVLDINDDAPPVIDRGTRITVQAKVELAGLSPDEALVECYRGPVTSKGEIVHPERTEMAAVSNEGTVWHYSVVVNGTLTGQVGYSVRVLPKHPALGGRYVQGLVRWA
ncbi:MAG TPA: alpha-glucan family phosphorylase [Spirochaetales bacterium]|nr:alpha-glucan family phosphorylase [Spirochaetales bacterium]HPS14651.1 alpha-glucan family phosphorylase [Spirochaetales bacterium]